MKTKTLSFKTKLIIFLEIFFLTINSFLGFFVWKQLSFMVREVSRNKLMAVASSTAAMVDAEKHENIRTEDDRESDAYKSVQAVLEKEKEANQNVDDIYTLRKSNGQNQWTFVSGAKNPDDDGITIGESYDSTNCPEMNNGLYGSSADYNINCDQWGCWLSGYAPIRDAKNETIAVLGVDISANDIMSFEKRAQIMIAITIIILTLLFPILLYFLLKMLLRPISAIVRGLENFRHDLSSRIDINSPDEFGLIASTFNRMAEELEDLYENLENKVRQKTRQLAQKMTEIKKEKAKDEALLSSIGEGMIAVDQNGRIMLMSQSAQKMLDIEAQDVIGKKMENIITMENDKGEKISPRNFPSSKAFVSAQKITFSGYILGNNNIKFPSVVTASPVILNDESIGAITIFRDITKEKEIDKAKSEFVSLASHQLKSPLASANWYLELLLDEDIKNNKEQTRKYLEKVERANHRMIDLVNSLLNVSRLEMGTFVIEPEPMNITALIDDIMEEFDHAIKKKKIDSSVHIGQNMEKFAADPKLLRIILQNLLSNAIKYTPQKGRISLTAEYNKENLVIKVSDTGYGIPKNQQDKIFTKLFRADNVKKTDTDGTGLGLYIVKSIIDNSGGMISFQSHENQGTVFSVFFPKAGMKKKKGTKKLN